jgi:hypothetical protein
MRLFTAEVFPAFGGCFIGGAISLLQTGNEKDSELDPPLGISGTRGKTRVPFRSFQAGGLPLEFSENFIGGGEKWIFSFHPSKNY